MNLTEHLMLMESKQIPNKKNKKSLKEDANVSLVKLGSIGKFTAVTAFHEDGDGPGGKDNSTIFLTLKAPVYPTSVRRQQVIDEMKKTEQLLKDQFRQKIYRDLIMNNDNFRRDSIIETFADINKVVARKEGEEYSQKTTSQITFKVVLYPNLKKLGEDSTLIEQCKILKPILEKGSDALFEPREVKGTYLCQGDKDAADKEFKDNLKREAKRQERKAAGGVVNKPKKKSEDDYDKW